MIDIENLVITEISTVLTTAYPNIYITSEYPETPSSFPCVFISEDDNTTYRDSQDNELNEHHASLMYSVSVFSNKKEGKKSEAKAIMNLVDSAFQNLKFTRTMKTPVPNIDRSIYRIEARYEAIVGRGIQSGNDTIYQIYRE